MVFLKVDKLKGAGKDKIGKLFQSLEVREDKDVD